MVVILVRHGDIDQPYATDPGLTPRGEQRVSETSNVVLEFGPFNKIYTSPKRRAIETAALILHKHAARWNIGTLAVQNCLREVGTPASNLSPEEHRRVRDAAELIERLSATTSTTNSLVVAHQNLFRCSLQLVGRWPESDPFLEFAGILIL